MQTTLKRHAQKLTGFVLLLSTAALAGCQSGRFTHYISPQISGRVLASDTRQPLAGVNVARVGPRHPSNPFGPAKGGELLTQPGGVRTDADGEFVLGTESAFALFLQPGWRSVPVVFSCPGYESFQTNYTGANVTSHSAADAPMISVGDILLQPLAR